MKNQSVQALLEDIRLVSEQNYEIVEAVRALVQKTFETTLEEVKCRIPDDRKAVLQINADAKRTSLSWPSSVFCS
jgi:hypothetical protein